MLLTITIFVCKKTITKLSSRETVDRLLKFVLEFVMYSCVALVLFLIYQLTVELLDFEWGAQGPGSLKNLYIFIFPPLALLAVLRDGVRYTLSACAWILKAVVHLTVYWPSYWALSPVIRGAGFYEYSVPWLYFPFYVAYPCVFVGVYVLSALFLHTVLETLMEANHPLFVIMLALYGISYCVFLAVHFITSVLVSYFLRPLWARSVRHKYTKRD